MNSIIAGIPDAQRLLGLCRHLIDPSAEFVTCHPGYGGTTLLRAATRHGQVIVKPHRSKERHHQEIHAYQHWTAVLEERVPQLLAVWDDPPVAILTALDGISLRDATLEPLTERVAFQQAGELLRCLHDAAPPRTTPAMTSWLADRGRAWLNLAESLLPPDRLREIALHLDALAQLGPVPAVPCHLDYAPRNLIWSPGTQTIGVVDFEHARYDLAARDLVRMIRHGWPNRPDLQAAFLTTYGPLSDLDQRIIERTIHLDELTSAVRESKNAATPVFSKNSESID